uniref:Uncharacterized protein n=1 Tax=Physcomitrium patens TaxID=3218 RepID=A0A7I3ZMS0_PHYPA
MNPSSKGLNRGAPIPPHPLEGFITVAREFLTPGLNRLKRAVAALIPHSLREIVVGGGRLLTSLARTVRQFPAGKAIDRAPHLDRVMPQLQNSHSFAS